MSKIAEQKALEAYPKLVDNTSFINQETFNSAKRTGYVKGYDQAMQDMARDADRLQYLSDELGYAYACGCKKTMQDFLEKACDYLQKNLWRVAIEDGEFRQRFVTNFKNYMKNESEK